MKKLSIVIPFYKRVEDFKLALRFNKKVFSNKDYEIVLCIDEPISVDSIMDIVDKNKDIDWKVIYNENDHEWRNPAPVINSGIFNSTGEYIYVTSPESLILNDADKILLEAAQITENCFCHGKCGAIKFSDYFDNRTIEHKYNETVMDIIKENKVFKSDYGSILSKKTNFFKVGLYSQQYKTWGGEDTNLRFKFEALKFFRILCKEAKILHISYKAYVPPKNEIRPGAIAISSFKNEKTFELNNIKFDWRNNK